jgi:plastocyanin
MRAEIFIAFAAAVFAAVSGPAQAETINVAIDKVAYAPVKISARVGDTIVWTNNDILAHTATSRDKAPGKAWDLMIMPKKSQSLTLKNAGEFDYYCRFHPNMIGHISVTP